MELKQLIADEDAVSPVIGVILMVAITVILAAVIGTFVLGLGEQVQSTTPQVSFSFDYDEAATHTANTCTLAGSSDSTKGLLTVTHDGGQQIDENRLSMNDDDSGDGPISDLSSSCDSVNDGSSISAGYSWDVGAGSDDKVRVIWTAEGGGNSGTIGQWTGPDA